ncbi:hypothetical protein TNCV_2223611 [Trichonephila clavipes]|nr:hypothetical protein TNCV_2223611 [Trichonephila clavipes]
MPSGRTSRACQLTLAGSLRVSESVTLKTAQMIRNVWMDFAVQITSFSSSRLGKTRPLPGHSSIASISAKRNFILVFLHPVRSPTREAVCRQSFKNQVRRLPGVNPEYYATTSGRGSNGFIDAQNPHLDMVCKPVHWIASQSDSLSVDCDSTVRSSSPTVFTLLRNLTLIKHGSVN